MPRSIAQGFEDFLTNLKATKTETALAKSHRASIDKLGVAQFVEHRDAADRLDKLRDHAEKLWAEAIKGASLDVLKVKSRNLQDEIFDGRKKNPPVFDAIFWIFRDAHEVQMKIGALALVREAQDKSSCSS